MAGAGDKFELPVSGQRIPHNWFTRLVLFLNSLVPRGDGNILVTHTPDGVTLKLNPKLLRQPNGAPPAAGGGGGTVTSAGFPDYNYGVIGPVTIGTTYMYTYPVWVIGEVYADSTGTLTGVPGLNPGYMAYIPAETGQFICIPIPANTSFTFGCYPAGSIATINLHIFKCL